MNSQLLLNNAELALAAYTDLSTDDLLLQTTALQEAGFSAEQATNQKGQCRLILSQALFRLGEWES